jgi:tetratricopeptide (TPR) repeat protein
MEPKALYERAKALLKEGDFAAAIANVSALLDQRPENKQALALRGKAYLGAAQYQKAIADLHKVKDKGSAERNLWLAYRGMGIDCLTAGNYQQAIHYFESTKQTSHAYADDTSFLRGLAYLEFAVQECGSNEGRSALLSARLDFDDMLGQDPTFRTRLRRARTLLSLRIDPDRQLRMGLWPRVLDARKGGQRAHRGEQS